MDPVQVGNAFLTHYYGIFDSNRDSLRQIYQPQSILSWEGKTFQGVDKIVEYIKSLQFQKVERKFNSIDVQPTVAIPGLIITITGTLGIDGELKPLKFIQVFNLVNHNNQYLLLNDFFRFVLD